jgi:hypothetical protein
MIPHRSPNDLGRIAYNEIQGIEPRGSLERIIADARGDAAPAADADLGVTVAALAKLADLLKSPADLKRQIADLDRAASGAKQAAEVARAEQKKVADAHAALDAERVRQESALAKQLKDHEAAMAVANAELASVKKQAADLKARAEQDSAVAAKLRADVERKYKAFAA